MNTNDSQLRNILLLNIFFEPFIISHIKITSLNITAAYIYVINKM